MAIKIQGDTVIFDDKVFLVGSGTTAERPQNPESGMIRFNTDLNSLEGYDGVDWGEIGGGATGSDGDQVFFENDQTVTASYTITVGKNAMTAGPITIDDGVDVIIPDGSRWVII
jgi:hypothetical protein